MNFKEMSIQEIAKEIHRNAVEKGFWDNPVDFETQIALFHSEVSEAFEAWRRDERPLFFKCNYREELKCALTDCNLCGYGKLRKPEGWAVELIDLMINIFSYFEAIENGLETDLWCEVENGKIVDYFENDYLKKCVWIVSNNFSVLITSLHHTISRSCFETFAMSDLFSILYACISFLKHYNLDWREIMQLKHEYNLTRPKLHGKRF